MRRDPHSHLNVVRRMFCKAAPRRETLRRALRLESLEHRELFAVSPIDISQAFQTGIDAAEGQSAEIARQAFERIDLPLVVESIDSALGLHDKLQNALHVDLTPSTDMTLQEIRDQLSDWGFDVQYLGTTADENGDLLRIHQKFTWYDEQANFDVGGKAGFSYFEDGVQGSLEGSVSGRAQPIEIDLTLGVDLVNNQPRFYVADTSKLSLTGLSASGTGTGNIAIKSLLDVNVSGKVELAVTGGFVLQDADHKVRVEELPGAVRGNLDGSLKFKNVQFQAVLPLISALKWNGEWNAYITNGSISFDSPSLSAPSAGSVLEGIARALVGAKNNTSFLGSVGGLLNQNIPILNQNVGEMIGVNEGLGWLLKSTSLDSSGLRSQLESLGITVHLPTDPAQAAQFIDKLIRGERVDLISFEQKGGDPRIVDFRRDLTLAKIPVYIGTIDVDAYVSAHFGWNFLVGMGVDTMGVYFDPNSHIGVHGSVEAGLKGSFKLGGFLELASIYGGLGLSAGLGVDVYDPDPSDGRLYLDEIFRDDNCDGHDDSTGQSFGQRILSSFDFYAFGEAYGHIGAQITLPWPLPDITLFDERFQIGTFWNSNEAHSITPADNRRLRGVRNDEQLSLPRLSDGTLLISGDSRSDRVVLTNGVNGVVEVNWLGHGKGTFTGISKVKFTGNDGNDRLEVAEGFGVRIEAYGGAGNDVLLGSSAADLLDGGDGDDRLDGREGNDTLLGQSGNDILKGRAGDDTIRGSDGDDTLDGGDGNDSIYGGAGYDYILGGRGIDRLFGEAGNDVLRGGDDNDAMDGGVGRDQLFGDSGDDTMNGGTETDTNSEADDMLYGGAGNDTMKGGNGRDVLDGEAGNDKISGEAGDDLLVGGLGNDTLDGGLGNDQLFGGEGNDTLTGATGDDVLHGDVGVDVLRGGDGNDRLNGGADADALYGDAGDDVLELDFVSNSGSAVDKLYGGIGRDIVAATGTVRYSKNAETGSLEVSDDIADVINVVQTSSTNFRAEQFDPTTNSLMNSFTFSLLAGKSSDIEVVGLFGLGGNDTLSAIMLAPTTGIVRSVTIDGGAGNDRLTGSIGNDVLRGGTGDDQLNGGKGNDELRGGDGDDTLRGDDGDDRLYGERGRDQLFGDIGRDIQYGGDGDDVLRSGSGLLGDLLYGGDGDDELWGGDGVDVIQGQSGNDTIHGGAMADILWGGSGNDQIWGDAGIDILNGGEDDDYLYATDGSVETPPTDVQIAAMINEAKAVVNSADTRYSTIVNELSQSNLSTVRRDELSAEKVSIGDQFVIGGTMYIEIGHALGSTIVTEILDGDAGNDHLYGGQFADTLNGGAGNDMIHYSHGRDSVFGGDDHDTYAFYGSETADDIRFEAETDPTTGESAAAIYVNGERQGQLDEVDVEAIGIYAQSGDDTVNIHFGNLAVADIFVDGGAGNDTIDATGLQASAYIFGGIGDDTITGGLGNDTIYGQEDNDVLHGGAGDDQIDGGSGVNMIWGGTDNDTLIGGDERDWINGDDGDDHVYGRGGSDILSGQAGDDWIYGEAGNDYQLIGGAGNDHLFGGEGDDTLDGGNDSDELFGGAGNDVLFGGIDDNADDDLYGGEDNDRILGGAGGDRMFGNAGDNTIIIDQSATDAWVTGGDDHNQLVYSARQNETILVYPDLLRIGSRFVYLGGIDEFSIETQGNAGIRVFRGNEHGHFEGTILVDGVQTYVPDLRFNNADDFGSQRSGDGTLTYMYSPNQRRDGQYIEYPNFDGTAYRMSSNGLPCVTNDTMHPPENGKMAVIRWQAPLAGRIRIQGWFEDRDSRVELPNGGIGWFVDHNSSNSRVSNDDAAGRPGQLATGTIANGGARQSFDVYQDVAAGDYIYIGVDPQANYNNDTTGYSWHIDYQTERAS